MRKWALFIAIAAAGMVLVVGCKQQATVDELLNKADALFDQKEFNDAYTLYRQAATEDPKNVHALVRLAECCLWLQDADRGLEWVEKALKVDPHSAGAWEKKGELLLAKGQAKDAVECFKKALAYDGSLNVARLNLSIALQALGRTEDAIRVAKEAVSLEPKAAEPHYKLATALERAGKYEEAEAEYRRAIALDSKHVPARVRLARLLIRQKKKYQEARKLAQEADQIQPGDGQAAVLAAWALYLSGDQKAAVRELAQVARAHPTNFEAWALLARSLKEMGNEKAARNAAEIAMRLAPRVRGRPLVPSAGRGNQAKKAGKPSGK